MMGMHPIASGSILPDDEVVTGRSATDRPELAIALVPEGRRLFPEMNVWDNLLIGLHHRATTKRRQAGALDFMFDLFPVLAQRQRQLAGTMSGGEQQMVALGRALVSRPRLLILDEPSLGLAPVIVDQVFDTIRAVAAEGMADLLAEQNTRRAPELSSRGDVLADGNIVLSAPADELLDSDEVRQAYLGDT
jgi:branched-chain amino acid transport system ATP-binding protein